MAQRFRETASIDSRLIRKVEGKELQEKIQGLPSGKLTESTSKATVGWEVPISKYDEENANGRIYPKALWERVIKEQSHIWKGAPMLADHPAEDEDGSPQNICGVWLEARIAPDGYVYGTFVPSGRLGEDLQDHLSKGLRAGTSSSGFGELMRDGKTVDPSLYLIERLSDWVLSPSQGTYFTYEAKTQETKNASDQRLGESAGERVIKETTQMTKLAKLEEKKFRKDMEIFLADAMKITDPQSRLKEFEEILSYLEDGATPDLREKIENKIEEQRKEISDILADAKKMKEELGVQNSDDLKKKLTGIADDTIILKEETKDWKKIASVLQEKLDKAREDIKERPTDAYVNHLKEYIATLRKDIKKAEDKQKELMTSINEAADAAKATVASVKKKSETITSISKTQRESIDKLIKALEGAKKQNLELKRQNRTLTKEKEALKEELINKDKVKLAPSPSAAIKKYVGFREAEAVDSYWKDLVSRHGEDILRFEEQIRSSKTLRDASAMYIRILPQLEESREIEAMRLPESTAVSMKERGQLLERLGVRVDPTSIEDRLPKGWV